MKYIFYLPLLLCFVPLSLKSNPLGAKPGDVVICTPEWKNYTQRNGKGLSQDLITVIYSKKSGLGWKGLQSLKNKRVGWMRGYEFDSFELTPLTVRVVEFGYLEYGVRKLMRGRIDYIMDYAEDVRVVVKKLKYEDKLHIHYNVLKGKRTYMAFANNSRGKKLQRIWDKGFNRLYRSGELHRMYRRYGNKSY